MDRRKFLMTAAAAATLAPVASAEWQCFPVDNFGTSRCEVGVPSLRFFPSQQECQNWCWAACIQMIFATQGRLVDQKHIVERLFGHTTCSTATGHQIIQTINGYWTDNEGYNFSAYGEALVDLSVGYSAPGAAAAAARELANGFPLINGAVGHATVLTAMQYFLDAYGRSQITQLTVRDPWPYNPSRRVLNMNEVYGTQFLCAVRVG